MFKRGVFMAQQKLELTWYGKENEIKVEPRLIIENPNLSYKSPSRDLFSGTTDDNMLIHGDNLIALKSLEKQFTKRIKCIYIDPPYNTGTAFEHYDDNLEHSIWLNLMKSRLDILKKLLSDDGCIFVQIDYNEHAYLKVLMDEIFGRNNYLTTITCKVKAPSGIASGAHAFFDVSEYILMYTKNKESFKFTPSKIDSQIIGPNAKTVIGVYNQLISKFETSEITHFSDFEDIKIEEMEAKSFSFKTIPSKERTEQIYYQNYKNIFRLAAISGGRDMKVLQYLTSLPNYNPMNVYSYSYIASQGKNKGKRVTNFIYKKQNILFLQDFVRVDHEKKVVYKQDIITNIFYNDWWQGLTGEGGVKFKNGQKPEILLYNLLSVCTKENDIVLDSFLGSGTTAAVAHKMKRRWIGIELGEHAYTHAKYRLDNIINGKDSTGITKLVEWNGGGGYKFYELSPTLIKTDDFGQEIINNIYNSNMLASAIALHEGYNYEPDQSVFWKQAKNGDSSYLFTTTKHLDRTYLEAIHSQMNEDEFLVISCKSFESNIQHLYKNISIKKIPQSLLKNCEFGVDNYNLNIINPPVYEEDDEDE